MAGEDTGPITPKDRMDKLDAILDGYERGLGLPTFIEGQEDTEVQKYLSMVHQDRERLTLEDCAEAALVLGSYAFYLQRALNRENARIGWAKSVLKDFIAGKESQYTGSWESQFHQAIKGDGYSSGVYKIQRYAQQRADRITYLATSIKSLSDLFVNLQKAKVMKG